MLISSKKYPVGGVSFQLFQFWKQSRYWGENGEATHDLRMTFDLRPCLLTRLLTAPISGNTAES